MLAAGARQQPRPYRRARWSQSSRALRRAGAAEPWQNPGRTLDPAAQVVVAGSLDTFQVYVWAVRPARLLDAQAGHEGPVVALAFSPAQPLLASASWDRTVRTWDVFRRGPGGRNQSIIFKEVKYQFGK